MKRSQPLPAIEDLEGRTLLSAVLTASLHGDFLETSPSPTTLAVDAQLTETSGSAFTGVFTAPGFHTYYLLGTEADGKISFKVDKTQTGSRVGTFTGTLRSDGEIIGNLDFTVGSQAYAGSLHLEGALSTFLASSTSAASPGAVSSTSTASAVGSLVGSTPGIGSVSAAGTSIGTAGTGTIATSTGTTATTPGSTGSFATGTIATGTLATGYGIGAVNTGGLLLGSTTGTLATESGLGGTGSGIIDTNTGTISGITDNSSNIGTILAGSSANGGTDAETISTVANLGPASPFGDTTILPPI